MGCKLAKYLLLSLGLLAPVCFYTACHGPKVTILISNPSAGGMAFYNEVTKVSGFVPYSQTDQFVCLSPTDAQTVLDYAEQRRK